MKFSPFSLMKSVNRTIGILIFPTQNDNLSKRLFYSVQCKLGCTDFFLYKIFLYFDTNIIHFWAAAQNMPEAINNRDDIKWMRLSIVDIFSNFQSNRKYMSASSSLKLAHQNIGAYWCYVVKQSFFCFTSHCFTI